MPVPQRRWRRSWLFAPGNSDKLLSKVHGCGSDAVILDLEDAVAGAEKQTARRKTAEAVSARAGARGPATFVRINALGGPLWREDVVAVVRRGLDGIRVPKAESPAQIVELDEALAAAESEQGLPRGAIGLTLTIESGAGMKALEALSQAPRVDGFAWGATDFAADLQLEPGPDELETLAFRSRLVLVSRCAGLAPPIASVHLGLEDEEGLRRTTLAAKRLGFFGRSCIHPRQLGTVHEVFTPGEAELDRARELLAEFERNSGRGVGAYRTEGGGFVDEAVVRRARRLVQLAEGLARDAENEGSG